MLVHRRCKYCETRFEVRREWQLFCSDTCKTRWHRERGEDCFYCGCPAQSRDHIVSVAERGKRAFKGQETVPSCHECNSALGDLYFGDILERIEYLIPWYTYKYKLDEGFVHWDEDELVELGKNLRAHIRKQVRKRERGTTKVAYLNYMRVETAYEPKVS